MPFLKTFQLSMYAQVFLASGLLAAAEGGAAPSLLTFVIGLVALIFNDRRREFGLSEWWANGLALAAFFAATLEFSVAFKVRADDLLRQAAELSQNVKLKFLRHTRQFRGAGRIEDDLERAHCSDPGTADGEYGRRLQGSDSIDGRGDESTGPGASGSQIGPG